MSHSTLDLLREYASLSGEPRDDFPFEHPSLFSSEVQAALGRVVETLPEAERAPLRVALGELAARLDGLGTTRNPYTFGTAPLDRLFARLLEGEVNEEYAIQLARGPDITSEMSLVYAQLVGQMASRWAEQEQWRPAVKLQRLLLEASNALAPGQEAVEVQRTVTMTWINIVVIATMDVPDGRLYRVALKMGEELGARADPAKDREFLGYLYHALGGLNLDPYTAGRISTDYVPSIARWKQRLFDELGEAAAWLPQEEILMPEPEQALALAEGYLRKAVAIREGDNKGISLKALQNCLEWEQIIGMKVDAREMVELARQALQYLSFEREPNRRIEMLQALKIAGVKPDPSEADRYLDTPLDQFVNIHGPRDTIHLVLVSGLTFVNVAPVKCLRRLGEAKALFDANASEEYRMNRLGLMLTACREITGTKLPAGQKIDLGARATELRQRAEKEKRDPAWQSAGLAALAESAVMVDQESTGLRLFEQAVKLAPDFWQDKVDLGFYLQAKLYLGLGVDAVNQQDWPGAVEGYAQAILHNLDNGFHSTILDLYARIYDVLGKGFQDPDVVTNVIVCLLSTALQAEAGIGEPAARWVQRLGRGALAVADFNRLTPEAINQLLQVLKGMRLSYALQAKTRYDLSGDGYGQQLLDQIHQAEQALGDRAMAQPRSDTLLGPNLILSSYVEESERGAGDSPEEQLSNLQRTFDDLAFSRLLGKNTGPFQGLRVEEVLAGLDDRTVLLDYYLGASRDGRMATYVFLFDPGGKIGIGGTVADFPDSTVSMEHQGKHYTMSPFSLALGALRDGIVAEPGPWPVSHDARPALEEDLGQYLGSLAARLEQLRQAGKDHLVIMPHGPLHYYPFHLMGKIPAMPNEPAHPLAEQWKITYLPNLRLLARRNQLKAPTQRPKELTAIGLSFQDANPFGLAPLPHSLDEVNRVAATFDGKPLVDKEATAAAFLDALRSSRYVHLSTHGQHNLSAAAFQCVFLSPSQGDDGRVFAYELLSQDLSGLELLTLSACETALGRFDDSDNLRGLPANFLLAGVETIIGTLWPVADEPAAFFFTTLYEKLKLGADRLNAFYATQQATRARFPRYRDWGAFYMLGEW